HPTQRVVHWWGDAPPARLAAGAASCGSIASIDPADCSLCAPLVAQGERLGALYVRVSGEPRVGRCEAADDDAVPESQADSDAGAEPGAEWDSPVDADDERLRLAGILAAHLSMAISNI